MKRLANCTFLLLCVLAVGVDGGERTLDAMLPDNAYLTVTVDGTCLGFRETPLHRFFSEPEVVAALEQFQPLFDKLAAEAAKEGTDLGAIVRLASKAPWTIALGPAADEPTGAAVLMCWQVGAEAGPLRKAADALHKAIQASGRPETAKPVTLADVPLTVQESKTGEPVYYGYAGPVFVMGNDQAFLTRALDPAAAKLQRPPLDSPAVLRMHYNHGALLRAFKAPLEAEPQTQKLLDGLGVSAIRTADFALVPKGKRLVTLLQIHMPDEAKRVGITKWLADSPPVDRALLKMVPRDTMLCYATSADLGEMWREIWDTVKRIDPDAGAAVMAEVKKFETRLGVSIGGGVLKTLDRGTLLITHGQTWLGGGAVVVQRVKDGDALEAAIVQMVNRLDLVLMGIDRVGAVRTQLKPFTYRGIQCHYLWLMGMPAMALPGSAPCYARHGNHFVFAQHPLYLKGYLDFLVDKAPSVMEHPGFQALQDAVPEQASLISFAAWPDTVQAVYNTLAPFLMTMQAIPDLPQPLDMANMPSSRLLRSYAKGTVLTSVFEKGRYRVELQGDGLDYLIPQVAPVGAVAVLAGMLLPALTRARGEARRIRDRNNLNQIAKGMATYLNEHGDNRFYPASLAELWDKKVIPDPGVFISPLDRAPPKLPNGLACSYVTCLDKYPKRLFLDDFPPNVAMGWDRISFPGMGGRRNVMFFDSHVEWVDEAQFQELMKQLDDEVKKHTRPRLPKGAAGGEL